MTEELKKIIEKEAEEYILDWIGGTPTPHAQEIKKKAYIAALTAAINNPSKYGLPHWVKASERLPEKRGEENKVIIENRNEHSYFVTSAFKNFHEKDPKLYFTLGSKSFLTTNGDGNGYSTFPIKDIYWLSEQPNETSSQATELENANKGLSANKKSLYDQWCDGEKSNLNNFTNKLFQTFQVADGSNRAKFLKEWPELFEGSQNI